MRYFLTILEGHSPESARPFFATEDPTVIAAVVQELLARLAPGQLRARVVDLARRGKAEPEADGRGPA